MEQYVVSHNFFFNSFGDMPDCRNSQGLYSRAVEVCFRDSDLRPYRSAYALPCETILRDPVRTRQEHSIGGNFGIKRNNYPCNLLSGIRSDNPNCP